MSGPTIVAITPLKSDSTRLKNKNFLDLGGFPLYHYATDTIHDLPLFDINNKMNFVEAIYCDDNTWLAIDEVTREQCLHVEEDTAPIGQDGNTLFKSMADEFIMQYQEYHVDWFLFYNVTTPFVQPMTYLNVLDAAFDTKYDSACTVLRVAGRMWQLEERGGSIPILQEPSKCQRTQDQNLVYLESEACWLVLPHTIRSHRRRVGHYPKFVGVNWTEAIDINYPGDLEVARRWAKKL